MLSIKDSKVVLGQMGLSENDLEEYEKLVSPFIELHKHVMKKNDISSETAEKLADKYVKEYFTKFMENKSDEDLKNINELELAGQAIKEFAINQNFDEKTSDILITNTHSIVKLFEKAFEIQNRK